MSLVTISKKALSKIANGVISPFAMKKAALLLVDFTAESDLFHEEIKNLFLAQEIELLSIKESNGDLVFEFKDLNALREAKALEVKQQKDLAVANKQKLIQFCLMELRKSISSLAYLAARNGRLFVKKDIHSFYVESPVSGKVINPTIFSHEFEGYEEESVHGFTKFKVEFDGLWVSVLINSKYVSHIKELEENQKNSRTNRSKILADKLEADWPDYFKEKIEKASFVKIQDLQFSLDIPKEMTYPDRSRVLIKIKSEVIQTAQKYNFSVNFDPFISEFVFELKDQNPERHALRCKTFPGYMGLSNFVSMLKASPFNGKIEEILLEEIYNYIRSYRGKTHLINWRHNVVFSSGYPVALSSFLDNLKQIDKKEGNSWYYSKEASFRGKVLLMMKTITNLNPNLELKPH